MEHINVNLRVVAWRSALISMVVGLMCKRTAPDWVQHQPGSLRIHSSQPTGWSRFVFLFCCLVASSCWAYILCLLAMIKCSICSYQCDIWYVSNWGLACHSYFSLGRCRLELAEALLRVAPAWHVARSSTPNDPRVNHFRQGTMRCQFIWRCFLKLFRVSALAEAKRRTSEILWSSGSPHGKSKLTWLVMGGDPAVRSRRVERATSLWGL